MNESDCLITRVSDNRKCPQRIPSRRPSPLQRSVCGRRAPDHPRTQNRVLIPQSVETEREAMSIRRIVLLNLSAMRAKDPVSTHSNAERVVECGGGCYAIRDTGDSRHPRNQRYKARR